MITYKISTSVLKESHVIKENTLAICLQETALWGEDKRKDGHHHRKRPFKHKPNVEPGLLNGSSHKSQ